MFPDYIILPNDLKKVFVELKLTQSGLKNLEKQQAILSKSGGGEIKKYEPNKKGSHILTLQEYILFFGPTVLNQGIPTIEDYSYICIYKEQ